MTSSQLEVMLAESVVAADEVNEFRSLLAPLTDVATEVPEPSAELKALLREGVGLGDQGRTLPLDRRRRRRGAVAGAVVLALSGVGAAGLSAAANILPRPLQHQVSKFSEDFLPFKLPEPAPRHSRHALDVVQVPKPGSMLRGHIESRDARGSTPTRSLDQSRRAINDAARNEHDPGHPDGAAGGPQPEQSAYSKPREPAPTASGPGDEPPPGSVDSEVHASSGSETQPANEPKKGGALDELRGPSTPPEDRPGHPPGDLPDKQDKSVGKHNDPGTSEQESGPTDVHEQPEKS